MAAYYATQTDVIDHYITPALGAHANDYNLNAIYSELRDANIIIWTPKGLAIDEDSTEQFWEIAARHDATENQRLATNTPDTPNATPRHTTRPASPPRSCTGPAPSPRPQCPWARRDHCRLRRAHTRPTWQA